MTKAKTNKLPVNAKDSNANVESKKNNMSAAKRTVKNVVASGKISKKSVVPPAKVMPPKKFMKEEESNDESDNDSDDEIGLNVNGVVPVVANGKMSKKSVVPPAKVMPPKKFMKEEESDGESDDDSDDETGSNVNGMVPVKTAEADVIGNGKMSKKSLVTPAKVMPPKKFIKEEESDDESNDEIELNLNEEQVVANDNDDDEDGGEDDNDQTNYHVSDDDGVDVKDVVDDKSENANSLIAVEDNDNVSENDTSEPEEKPIKRKVDIVESSLPKRSEKLRYFNYMPQSMPDDQIILISNLPIYRTFNHLDIAKVFHKYGKILSIVIFPSLGTSTAYVAYNTAAEAQAALEANNTAQVKQYIVNVAMRIPLKLVKIPETEDKLEGHNHFENLSRTLYVKNNCNCTEDDLRAHFKSCGNIERISLTGNTYIMLFENEDAIEKGLKLNGSMLNGAKVNVNTKKIYIVKDDVKITVLNTNNYQSYEEAKLREIFSKCGEIKQIDMLCRFKVLAFITFEKPSDVENALKLNGTRVDDLDINVTPYQNVKFYKQSIFIENIADTVTNENISEHFKDVGPTISIERMHNIAIVKFETTDEYCKSFSLNETFIEDSLIFIKPYWNKKPNFMNKPVRTFKPYGTSPKPYTKRPYLGKKTAAPHFYSLHGPPNKVARPNF